MAFPPAYTHFVEQTASATVWHDANLLRLLASSEAQGEWFAELAVYDGQVKAALPHFRKRQPDGWSVVMPPLLRYCDPLFASAADVPLLNRVLPKGYRSFDQDWSVRVGMKVPDGFTSHARPTYLVDLTQGEAGLFAAANKTMRKRMRRAEAYWRTERGPLTPEVHDLLERPLVRDLGHVPYDRKVLTQAFNYLRARGQAVSHQAYSPEGVLLAASVAVCDAHSVYCWLSGSDDSARSKDGGSYVLWNDLLWGLEQGVPVADFMGSSLPGPAENRRQLGGIRTQYRHLRRDAAWWRAALRKMRS